MGIFHLKGVKITVGDFIIATVILSVTFAAIFFAFDPREVSAKKYDSMFSPTAKTIQNAIVEHFNKTGTNYPSSFGFMKGDQAVNVLGIESEFSNDEFIMGNLSNFYIGKEKGTNASFYVCFAPKSRFVRDSNCNDGFVYTLNADGTRTQVSCGLNANWSAVENPWVICNPR